MLRLQSKVGYPQLSNTSTKIVVVLPAYNEAGTIEHTILEANDYFPKIHPNLEYLVAEDGSTDATVQVLFRLRNILPCLKVSSSPKRKGYPAAVRDGILSVGKDADYILFMDSDGQYDPRDFRELVRLAEYGDIVVGGRISRAESPLRVFLSTGVRVLEQKMFGLTCRDVTSAFRLMRRDVAQTLASRAHYSKYNFWTEFTALAAVFRYKIVEVPVSYRNRQSGDSRVYRTRKLARVVLSEFVALASIWIGSVVKPSTQPRQA
jgi:glycosyltransferase involved in cell wall biosynthesis